MSELGPCTEAMLHRLARMDITGMHRMPARRTATMDLIGSMAACSLELDRGSTGSVEATGAVAASVAEAVLVDVDLRAGDLKDAVGSQDAAPLAVDSTVAAAFMVVVADSTAVAAFMVAVAVSTAVAVAMAAVGTGN